MSTLQRKVQVLLDEEQYRALRELAAQQRLSISALVRGAVIEHLLTEARRERKRAAFEAIAALDLPVADWAKMEAESQEAHEGTSNAP